jgi:hypothetical protein
MKLSNKTIALLEKLNLNNNTTVNYLITVLECEYHDADILQISEIRNRITTLEYVFDFNKELLKNYSEFNYMLGDMILNYQYILNEKEMKNHGKQ